jgi:hypothetical protein
MGDSPTLPKSCDRGSGSTDFQFDTTCDGRTLKLLHVVDAATARGNAAGRAGPTSSLAERLTTD